jgi:hypothetical protein
MLNHEAFKFQVKKSRFSFLLDLIFWVASLWVRKLRRHFKYIMWTSFNCYNFIAYIKCTNPFCNYYKTIYCIPAICFKSTNRCCMNILFSLVFEISLKMRSQIFFARFSILYGTRLVLGVCYKQGMKIGQGLNMLLNPPFKITLSEL